jgi:hypothetical protein
VYVDDIVVKIKSRPSLLDNITLIFDRLRSTRTKLNPDKCVFRVTAVKLLSFLVSYRGIEANPEKIRAIEMMQPPARIKDVQRLTGWLAALSRFISRLAEQALLFFRLLRKYGPFVWTNKAEEAFQELKQYLMSLSVMVAPEPGEHLLLYIATTAEAVSIIQVAERPEPPQPQETKETSANDLGSQDPELVGSLDVGVTAGSQLPEASLAPKPHAGPGKPLGPRPQRPTQVPTTSKPPHLIPPRHF